jgi:uroporphyrinogen decarboxylase
MAMKSFKPEFTQIETFYTCNRKPDFNNLLRVLNRKKPTRPTLFEMFLGKTDILTAHKSYDAGDPLIEMKKMIDAYLTTGYDFAFIRGTGFKFKSNKRAQLSSVSLNDGFVITNREEFEAYEWMEPEDTDFGWIPNLGAYLPDGMKLLVPAPDGIFETIMTLVGYDNLCLLLYDDPELVGDIFDAVGTRYTRYYEICARYDAVGALVVDDDWGFKTQTFLSAADMRKYIVPWHKVFANTAHKAGKPIILHSCGNNREVMDDIIEVIKHDGYHSFEDTILPVEEAYAKYAERIAILGGIDVDYLCRAEPDEIYKRSAGMLERSRDAGGYALGSGNSIPDYMPTENFLAMIAAAVFNEW